MIDGLPDGARAKVFRRIVDQLKTDPVLSYVVKAWDVLDGQSADRLPGNVLQCPYIKLVPRLGTVGWYSPDAQAGPLEINIQVGVQGMEAADYLNLWDAFERAFYPYNDRDKQLALEQDLASFGAEPAQVMFARPASVADIADAGGDLQFTCLGMMSINIVRPFNP
jgi:hypothetical protein